MSGSYQYQYTGQQQYNQPYPASSGPPAHLLAILGSGRGNAAATGLREDAGAGSGTRTGGGFIHEPAPHLASTPTHIQLQQPQPQSQNPQPSPHYPQHSPFPTHQPYTQTHASSTSQSPAHFGQYDGHPQPPRNSTPHTLVQQAFPPSAPFLAPSTLHAAAPPPPCVVPASTSISGFGGAGTGQGYGGTPTHGVSGGMGAKPGAGAGAGGKMGLLGILNGKMASASSGPPHVSSGWNDGVVAYEQAGHDTLGKGYTGQAGSSGGEADIYTDAASAPSYSQSSNQHLPPNAALQAPMASTAATAAPIPELELDISLDLDVEVEADSIFRDMTFEEVLEELNARFLVNLPREEMGLVRVYWQAEQAHWFYEDYLRPLNPHLPSLSQRQFSQLLIASSPIYPLLAANASASSAVTDDAADAVDPAIISVGPSADVGKGQGQGKGGKGKAKGKKQQQQQLQAQQQARGIDYDAVWAEYVAYKSMVPCCGGIILNEAGDKALMVRGYKSSAGWCFPRGKININEPELSCAIREVYEETGFDLTNYIKDGARDRIQTQINAQTVTMFIAMGVEEGTRFEARTKKEIGAIEWVPLVDLPTWSGRKQPKRNNVAANEGKAKRYYNVTPFVGPLKKWLIEHHIPINPKQRKNANPMLNGSNGVSGASAGFGRGMGSYASSDVPGLGLPGARDLQPFFGAAPAVPAVPAGAHTGVGSGKDGMNVQSRTQPRQTQSQPLARNHVPGQTQGQGQGKGHDQGHGNGSAKPSIALDQLFGQFASISAAQAPTHVQHDLSTQRTAITHLPAEPRPDGVNAGLDALFGSLGVFQRPAASHDNVQSGRRSGADEAGGQQGEGAGDGMDEMGEDALAQLLGSPVSPLRPSPMGMGGARSSDGGARAAQDRASTGAQGGAGPRAKTEKQEKQEKLLALLGGARPGVAASVATRSSQGAKAAQAKPALVASASASALATPPSQSSHTSSPGVHERESQQVGQAAADAAIGEGKGMTRRQSNLLSMLSPPQPMRSLLHISGDRALGGLADAVPVSTTQQGSGTGTQAQASARTEYTGWDAGDGTSIDSADGVAGAPAGVDVKRKQRQADLLASLAGLGGVSAPAPSAEGGIGSPIESGSYASPPAQQGLLPRVPSFQYANNTMTSPTANGQVSNQQHRLLSALQGPPVSSATSQYQQAVQHPQQYQSHPPFGDQPTTHQTGAQPQSGTGHAYHQYDTAAAPPGRQADFGYDYQKQHGRRALAGQGQGQGQPPDAHVNVLHPIPKAGPSMGLLAMLNGK